MGRGESKLGRVAFLLDHGADLNRPDVDGDTPFLCALYGNQTKTGILLLRRGSNPSAVNKSGQNALHLMAIYANVGGFEGLGDVAHHFKGLDPIAKDASGKTPRENFNEKDPPSSPELRRAFEEFMGKLQEARAKDNSDDEEEELFFDAQEAVQP
ncbi:hypothetical protein B0T25DRAFT_565807 [Lasiosphaeria hispida]|uniref:Ankyrin repeat protein n=1 Tax=Lasiosphaeria hispida TaxID=260671 RepID=A0AAJ0HKV1_9PEZI|nr:hypothetical protein B0T25DRAFT_565807 [Lasiosphaeria hispida]